MGDVSLAGAALPAVRIELNPRALFKYGIGLEDVRAAISAANAGANSPKGAIDQGASASRSMPTTMPRRPSDYQTLIIAYRNNAPVRLSGRRRRSRTAWRISATWAWPTASRPSW